MQRYSCTTFMFRQLMIGLAIPTPTQPGNVAQLALRCTLRWLPHVVLSEQCPTFRSTCWGGFFRNPIDVHFAPPMSTVGYARCERSSTYKQTCRASTTRGRASRGLVTANSSSSSSSSVSLPSTRDNKSCFSFVLKSGW